MRADSEALTALALTDEELVGLGLDQPVPINTPPDQCAEVYIRRSRQREDITTLKGHLLDVGRWVRRDGLVIRHVWLEQLSASKHSVARREYEAACAAITEHGLSRTLAVWNTDRLDRRGMGAVGALIDRLDACRARAVFVTEGLDSSQPGARAILAFLAERAREAARDIARHSARGHAAHRVTGRRGPGADPYGIISDSETGKVRPLEAERPGIDVLRECLVTRELSYGKTRQILNEAGITTRAGALWSIASVARLAANPLIAGMVPAPQRREDEHGVPMDKWERTRGPLLSESGEIVRCGEGWLTPSEWMGVRQRAQERAILGMRQNPSRHLLSAGDMPCPLCDGPMSKEGPSYRCSRRINKGPLACPGTSITAARADDYVRDAWISFMGALGPEHPLAVQIAREYRRAADPSVRTVLDNLTAAARAASERLARLEDDYYVHARLSIERFTELRGTLERMRDRAVSSAEETRDGVRANTTMFVDHKSITAFWDARTIPERRLLLRAAIRGKIRLSVARGRGIGNYDPPEKRIDITWVE